MSSTLPAMKTPEKLASFKHKIVHEDSEQATPGPGQPTTSNSLTNCLAGSTFSEMMASSGTSNSLLNSAAQASRYPLVLEVEDESTMTDRLATASTSTHAVETMRTDSRWQLVVGYQCSLFGQLMKFFEQLSSLNSCATATSGGSSNNAAAWEYALRSRCDAINMQSLWGASALRPAEMEMAMIIRQSASSAATGSGRLDRLLRLAELDAASDIFSPPVVSEWQRLAVFVEVAGEQVT